MQPATTAGARGRDLRSDLRHEYDTAEGIITVLEAVALDIAPADFVAITGASGAGKTTLLSLIGGLERIQHGTIEVGDVDLGSLSGDALAAYRRTTIGFVFQDYGLLGTLTAHENVELALTFAGLPLGKRRSSAPRPARCRRPGEPCIAPPGGAVRRREPTRRDRACPRQRTAPRPRRRTDRQPRRGLRRPRAALLHSLPAEHGCTVLVVTHNASDRETLRPRASPRRRPRGSTVSWRDALLFAARSVRRRLGRAALTVLAVALASALLSSLLIAGGVARSRVLDAVTRGGPLTGIKVDAAEPDISALDSDVPARKGPPRSIDDRAIRRIRALRGVRSVNPVLVHPIFVLTPDPAVTATRTRRSRPRRRRQLLSSSTVSSASTSRTPPTCP